MKYFSNTREFFIKYSTLITKINYVKACFKKLYFFFFSIINIKKSYFYTYLIYLSFNTFLLIATDEQNDNKVKVLVIHSPNVAQIFPIINFLKFLEEDLHTSGSTLKSISNKFDIVVGADSGALISLYFGLDKMNSANTMSQDLGGSIPSWPLKSLDCFNQMFKSEYLRECEKHTLILAKRFNNNDSNFFLDSKCYNGIPVSSDPNLLQLIQAIISFGEHFDNIPEIVCKDNTKIKIELGNFQIKDIVSKSADYIIKNHENTKAKNLYFTVIYSAAEEVEFYEEKESYKALYLHIPFYNSNNSDNLHGKILSSVLTARSRLSRLSDKNLSLLDHLGVETLNIKEKSDIVFKVIHKAPEESEKLSLRRPKRRGKINYKNLLITAIPITIICGGIYRLKIMPFKEILEMFETPVIGSIMYRDWVIRALNSLRSLGK